MEEPKEEKILDPEIKKLVEDKDRQEKMYARPNRAQRRQKPPDNPWYTKATNKFNKIRKKNAERNKKRQRAAKRAGKISTKSNTKVS